MTTVVCSKCSLPKGEEEFHRDASKPTGFRPDCKACRHLEAAEYYHQHADELKKAGVEWRRNNPEKSNAIYKRWRDTNSEIALARNRQWQKNNRAYDAARSAKQRAELTQATPTWANENYILLFYDLAKMEEERTGKLVHVDHIVPLKSDVVCGLHVEDNLQLLFAKDNIKKKNRF